MRIKEGRAPSMVCEYQRGHPKMVCENQGGHPKMVCEYQRGHHKMVFENQRGHPNMVCENQMGGTEKWFVSIKGATQNGMWESRGHPKMVCEYQKGHHKMVFENQRGTPKWSVSRELCDANLGFCCAVEKTRQIIFTLISLRQHFVCSRKFRGIHQLYRSDESLCAELSAEVNLWLRQGDVWHHTSVKTTTHTLHLSAISGGHFSRHFMGK